MEKIQDKKDRKRKNKFCIIDERDLVKIFNRIEIKNLTR